MAEQLIQRGYATYPIVGAGLDPAYTGEGVRIRGSPPAAGAAGRACGSATSWSSIDGSRSPRPSS